MQRLAGPGLGQSVGVEQQQVAPRHPYRRLPVRLAVQDSQRQRAAPVQRHHLPAVHEARRVVAGRRVRQAPPAVVRENRDPNGISVIRAYRDLHVPRSERVAARYRATPTFVFASATVADPAEQLELGLGENFVAPFVGRFEAGFAAPAQLAPPPAAFTPGDLARAALLAMIDWLEAEHGLSRPAAYCLCSACVDLHLSEVVDVPYPLVSALIPLDVFEAA